MKGIQMMKRFFQRILGVPAESTEAALSVSSPVRRSQDLYLPESRVHPDAITGCGPSGECYEYWRTDANSVRWFKKISAQQTAEPEIHGFSPIDEDESDSSDDSEDIGTEDQVAAFQRNVAILKSRYHRGEIGDLYGDNDDSQDFDDEN